MCFSSTSSGSLVASCHVSCCAQGHCLAEHPLVSRYQVASKEDESRRQGQVHRFTAVPGQSWREPGAERSATWDCRELLGFLPTVQKLRPFGRKATILEVMPWHAMVSVTVPHALLQAVDELVRYVNCNGYSILPQASMASAFMLFRRLGLRHLPVVDHDGDLCSLDAVTSWGN